MKDVGVKKGLPKGTPLVVNASVYHYFRCKVRVIRYVPETDIYQVESAEDHVDLEGWKTKSGKALEFDRACLFGADEVPNDWPEDIREFVAPAPSAPSAKESTNVQQVLIFRRDLKKCRTGKLCAQAGHAAMMFIAEQLHSPDSDRNVNIFKGDRTQKVIYLTPEQREWFSGKFTKISLVVDGEQELLDLHGKALEMGLTAHIVRDAGLTEFHGVETVTCLAIGPHEKSRIDPLTSKLSLF